MVHRPRQDQGGGCCYAASGATGQGPHPCHLSAIMTLKRNPLAKTINGFTHNSSGPFRIPGGLSYLSQWTDRRNPSLSYPV